MDGENNGSKPYEQMDDLGVNAPIFGNIHVGFSRNSDYQPGPVPASTRFDTVVLFYLNMSKFYL